MKSWKLFQASNEKSFPLKARLSEERMSANTKGGTGISDVWLKYVKSRTNIYVFSRNLNGYLSVSPKDIFLIFPSPVTHIFMLDKTR